jgi:hypothetical protein
MHEFFMHHNVVNRINLDPPGPGAVGIFYPSLLMIDNPILKPSLLKHGASEKNRPTQNYGGGPKTRPPHNCACLQKKYIS